MRAKRTFGMLQTARIVLAMGWSDFSLKYRGSILGYCWSLALPLTKFVVILHVFRPFVSEAIPSYPLYLFLGIVIWEHFALTTTACMSTLVEKASLVQKVAFPRIVLMLSVGWLHMIILGTYVCIFFVIGWWFGLRVNIGAAYVLVTTVQATLFALGVGMFLSSFSLKFRDIPHLWTVALQVVFWLTPIAYPHDIEGPFRLAAQRFFSGFTLSLSSVLDTIIHFQPLSLLLYDLRRAVLYADTLGMPSVTHLAATSALCIGVFAVGVIVFRIRSRSFVQEY